MVDYLKNNKVKIFGVFFSFLIGGIAIGTSYQLYRMNTTAPQKSAASGETNPATESCSAVIIPITQESPTPTPTATPTSSPTATPTGSPTSTPTATPITYSCDTPCLTDDQCRTANKDYICYSATRTCRHINYPQQNNCQPQPTSTASPTSTPVPTPTSTSTTVVKTSAPTHTPTATPVESLPDAGVSTPTIVGITVAGLLLIASIILAL